MRGSKGARFFAYYLKSLAEKETFDSTELLKLENYKTSKFLTISKNTGLINRKKNGENKNIYVVHERMKKLASLNDQKVMNYFYFYVNVLRKVPKRIPEEHIYRKIKLVDKYGFILNKFRRFHPKFQNLFIMVGIEAPKLEELDPINIEYLPEEILAESQESVEVFNPPIEEVKKEKTELNDDTEEKALTIFHLMKKHSMSVDEAIALNEIKEKLSKKS